MEAISNGVKREFAQLLLSDIQNRRTLPDHILREVIREGKRGLQALGEYLSALEQSLGDRITATTPQGDDDGVIVTIDHTR
jgi:hypothetical protein